MRSVLVRAWTRCSRSMMFRPTTAEVVGPPDRRTNRPQAAIRAPANLLCRVLVLVLVLA